MTRSEEIDVLRCAADLCLNSAVFAPVSAAEDALGTAEWAAWTIRGMREYPMFAPRVERGLFLLRLAADLEDEDSGARG